MIIYTLPTQYFSASLSDDPWSTKLRADINAADSIFLIGYSIYDFDVAKIIFQAGQIGSRVYFIQHEMLSASQENKLKRFGSVHTIGIEAFSDLVKELYLTEDRDEMRFLLNFREIAITEKDASALDDKSAYSLIIDGKVDDGLMQLNYSQKEYTYGVKRDAIDDVVSSIADGEKSILIRGDIGNGKNFFSTDLTSRMISQFKRRVFIYEPVSDEIKDDIEYFENLENPVIYFSDTYAYSQTINNIRISVPSAVIISSTRTAIHELERSKLKAAFEKEPFEVDLDTLNDNEITSLISYLNNYGFWGQYQGFGDTKKKEIISKDCKRSLRALILKLFESPSIKAKILAFISNHKSNEDFFEGFLRLSLLSATGLDLSYGAIREILGVKFANTFRLKSEELILEFYHFDKGRQVSKSSVVSEFVLKHATDDAKKIETIVDLIDDAYRLSLTNDFYKPIPKHFMRFSFIERLLDGPQKAEKLVRFYEGVRKLRHYNRNPQFWLQYAIARMSFRDYDLAGQYFDDAYGITEHWEEYDRRQIDTQYSRYLIETHLYGGTYGDWFENLTRAINIILALIGGDSVEHHPYRVANIILDYCEKYGSQFTTEQKLAVINYSKEILSQINKLPDRYKRHKYVKNCDLSMKSLIDYLR